MGRPTKLTPEVQERILRAIRLGATREVAARAAGVDERTFYRWLQRGEAAKSGQYCQFRQAMARAESEGEITHLEAIAADGGAGSKWILSRRHPERWTEVQRHEVSGKDGTPLVVKFVERPPDNGVVQDTD